MISKVVRWLQIMVVEAVAAGMGFALLSGLDPAEIAPLAVILLVSAIPVAMPTMFTISMALGSFELSKKGAIVTRLYIGMYYFELYGNLATLQTFVFVWLTLSGYYTVVSIGERRHFWDSRPSEWLGLALIVNSIIVFVISTIGLPDLPPITPTMNLFIAAYGFVTCLLLNDFVKVPLAKDRDVSL
jgi:hypothetical protein